ncbi:NAD-dependent epimerase/dehydratase family protein [Corynebacterium pseudopelargi]|uniref:NAD dependent epimerase/dehydratase family protein n=1 Tax=Corynebacterium pseudopelargi TaxID=2080757 RepID=A0A3G6IUF1_9CORY|nr:NAD-dependent epimerase/dehydratase family protein [Corynebacterium pseudopelargi]AZA08248.1 NAD dependent epimerase/dehydratase family protein [Corynebacterium pseudopelargi]
MSEHQPTICIVGAGGFLAWHVRLHAWAHGFAVRGCSTRRDSLEAIAAAIANADLVVHLAACNRPAEGQTLEDAAEATRVAGQITAQAIELAARQGKAPKAVSIAGTTQEGTAYADAKRFAGEALFQAAGDAGVPATQWLLPNLFGEHGTPRHNMVTATFIQALLDGETPQIHGDNPITLLAARHAAELLLAPVTSSVEPGTHAVPTTHLRHTTVPALLGTLQDIHQGYQSNGALPDTADPFINELCAAYLSHAVPLRHAVDLVQHSDERGSFVETVRAGGQGQVSFSTTVPGITRGNHLHLRKIERFVVLKGEANIEMRKHGSDERILVHASGDAPKAVDMLCGWTHNITNVGSDILYTQFWINEPFDPADPDTFYQEV